MRAASEGGLAVLLVVTALLTARSALADDPPLADRLFEAGRQAMAVEDYRTALARFEASYRAEPALGTLLNVAVCEEKLGAWTAALGHLAQGLQEADASDRRRPSVLARFDALSARVPHLTLRASVPLAPGVVVTLDATPVDAASLGSPRAVDPGTHVVRCQADGRVVCSHEITAAEGKSLEQWVEPDLAVPATPTAMTTTTATDAGRRTRATIRNWTGGVGVASLALGLAAGAEVLAAKGTMSRHCDAGGCDPSGLSAAASGRTWSWVSTIATGVGLAGVGTCVTMAITLPSSSRVGAAEVAIRGSF
ncbi:MAG TPA: hypothetical protein VKU41_07065 [Polyangiaceae bacterium]|nr:hypothetical protein [Polyangiaceae bacterium]